MQSLQRDALAPTATGRGLTIAFFGHDSGETTILKRVRAFQLHGAEVIGLMFRRVRPRSSPAPTWQNIDLGVTRDRAYADRLGRLPGAVAKAMRHRKLLARCSVFYARNIDMLLIATLAKVLTRSRAILVYEALDVQQPFIGPRASSRLLRWVERRLLAFSDLLVVSSPDHFHEYFRPTQGYAGRWQLLENKVGASASAAQAASASASPKAGPPWIIGFFGVLKCARSLEILRRTAAALPDKVIIHIRGQLSETDIPRARMQAVTESHPNIVFHGPYESPRDLSAIYGEIHMSWAADFLAPGGNSVWCLPNRLYEGGLYGCVAVTSQGTATARMVEREGLGWTLPEPLETTLAEFLSSLDAATFTRMKARTASLPRSKFCDEGDTAALLLVLEELARDRFAPAHKWTTCSEQPQ